MLNRPYQHRANTYTVQAELLAPTVCCVCLCALIYAPAVFFPYYLLDDIWIFRTWEPGFVNVNSIAVYQGRPIFAAFVVVSKWLHQELGITAVSLIRGQAIVFLGLFAAGLYTWVKLWTASWYVAAIFTLIVLTLPASQMYVIGGPWFAPAFALSAWLPVFLYRTWHASWGHITKGAAFFCAWCGVGACFAMYQATPFIIMSMLILPLLVERNTKTENVKFVFLSITLFVTALLVYWLLWLGVHLLLDLPNDNRYSPQTQSKGLLEHFRKIPGYIEAFSINRIPMIATLWDVRAGAINFSILFAVIITLGALPDLILRRTRSEIINRIGVGGLAVGLVLFSDLPALASPKGSPVFTYMTAAPATLSVMMLLLVSMIALKRTLSYLPSFTRYIPSMNYNVKLISCYGLAALLGGFAAYTSTAYYVLPAYFEHAALRSELRKALAEKGTITAVSTYARSTRALSHDGQKEYGWSNFGSSFYIHWLIRRVLDNLGVQSNIRIAVHMPYGETLVWPHYTIKPTKQGLVIIDFRHLTLDAGAPLERQLFEISARKISTQSE